MTNGQDLLLRKLINLNKNESGEIFIEGINEIEEYNRYLLILKRKSQEDKKIQKKLELMRYYFEFGNQPFFVESKEILTYLKQKQTPSYELFIDLLYNKLDEMQLSYQIKKYILYYPININKFQSEINEFLIGDFKIKLLNYSDVKNDIDKVKIRNQTYEMRNFDKTCYQYARVSIWCRNKEYAQQKATRYVELILSFISYLYAFRVLEPWIMGFPKPLIELKLNYIFVFENDIHLMDSYFEDTSDSNKFYDLDDNVIKVLNTMIYQFNESDKSIQEIIFNSMEQYNLGLKEKTASRSFLSFWTSLEILTLKNKNLSHFKVKERLKSVIKMDDIHEYQIERLYTLRNKLVHTGNHSDISPHDRNLIKMYVEALFEFFMFNFSKYNYSEINMIYEFLPKDVNSLEKSKKFIDEVIRLKDPI